MSSVSDEEIAALMAVATSPRQLEARRRVVEQTFEDNAADAALVIIDLAKNSPHDKIRLDAAKYIVERTIGKIKEQAEDTTSHWEKVFQTNGVIVEPSKHELTGPPRKAQSTRDIEGEHY